MLLDACADTRLLSNDARNRLGAKTVHQVAWSLLTRQFLLEDDGISVTISTLNDVNALKCAAALLLQHHKFLSQDHPLYIDAARKIVQILKNVPMSCRLLDPPDDSRIWRLDDVLFDTLKAISRGMSV